MTGLIDVGGGLRDIYGAGVLDTFMDMGIRFDKCYGVSAGAANCISYIAGQKGRNYLFYTEYARRPGYMSFRNLLKKGCYLDLRYVYGTLSDRGGDYPLDFESALASDTELEVTATDAVTGEPVRFLKSDMAQDDYRVIMASCCIPVVCETINIGGRDYYDGGLSDPLPLKHALEDGCDKVAVILTRPVFDDPGAGIDRAGAALMPRKHRKAAEALRNKEQKYKEGLRLALRLRDEGAIFIAAPDNIDGLSTLTKDGAKLNRLYACGARDAERIAVYL